MKLVEGTVSAMLSCNNLSYRWMKVYYHLKDQILKTYGAFCDLTHQQWYDMTDDYYRDDNGNMVDMSEPYAVHNHILERWLLGSVFFHIPTDEFYYINYNMGVSKKSEHYSEMSERCFGTMVGKKKKSYDRADQEKAWKSLKWLMRQYGHLIEPERMERRNKVNPDIGVPLELPF